MQKSTFKQKKFLASLIQDSEKPDKRLIQKVFDNKYSKSEVDKMIKEYMTKSNFTLRSTNRWTNNEVEILLNNFRICSAQEMEKLLPKRTYRSMHSKYYRLVGTEIDVPPTKQKGKRKKVKVTENIRVNQDTEFEILVSFYELPIDELREKFNMKFWEIARIMESINDLTEPHHSSLLLAASRYKNSQKQTEPLATKESRKEAKRKRKMEKKKAKLEKQLLQLQEEN